MYKILTIDTKILNEESKDKKKKEKVKRDVTTAPIIEREVKYIDISRRLSPFKYKTYELKRALYLASVDKKQYSLSKATKANIDTLINRTKTAQRALQTIKLSPAQLHKTLKISEATLNKFYDDPLQLDERVLFDIFKKINTHFKLRV